MGLDAFTQGFANYSRYLRNFLLNSYVLTRKFFKWMETIFDIICKVDLQGVAGYWRGNGRTVPLPVLQVKCRALSHPVFWGIAPLACGWSLVHVCVLKKVPANLLITSSMSKVWCR